MSTMTDMTCTCGDRDEHIVARRRTADHFDVTMWCNGCIAQWTGAPLPGVPIARPRTAEAWHRERAAAWLFVGEVELYDLDEVSLLHAACRRVAARGDGVPELRADLVRAEEPRVRFDWYVEQRDARGDVTLRTAVLDRVRWPGLVVWHEHGRYELLHTVMATVIGGGRREALESTGFAFASQRELVKHLFTVQRSA